MRRHERADGEPPEARRHVPADGQLLRQVPGRRAVQHQRLRRLRPQLGTHPGSAGYYTIDECLVDADPGRVHAVRAGCGGSIPTASRSRPTSGPPTCRCGATPPTSSRPTRTRCSAPSRRAATTTARWPTGRRVTREAVKDARPFMTVLQFFKFTSLGPLADARRRCATTPTWPSSRAPAACGGGASATTRSKDVCSGWCAEKTTHMNNLKTVVNEIADLEAGAARRRRARRARPATRTRQPSARRVKVRQRPRLRARLQHDQQRRRARPSPGTRRPGR